MSFLSCESMKMGILIQLTPRERHQSVCALRDVGPGLPPRRRASARRFEPKNRADPTNSAAVCTSEAPSGSSARRAEALPHRYALNKYARSEEHTSELQSL